MRLNRGQILSFFAALLSQTIFLLNISAQSDEFNGYLKKYPNNSMIIVAFRQNLEIEFANGKPVLNFSEDKQLLALNDNANYYSNSRELFGGTYKLKEIKAYTMVPEKNDYRKIPVSSFNKTSETSDYSFYDDVVAYNFTYPSVVKGAKMYSQVQMVSEDPAFPFKFYFGDFFPSEEFSFTVTCPENIEIRYKLYGYDTSSVSFNLTHKSGKKIYSWRAVNTRTYTRDGYAPAIEYFIPHVIIQISKYTWKGNSFNVISSLDDLYKWHYKKICNLNQTESPEIKALTDSLTRNQSSDKEKVRSIFKWVQNNIKYIAFEDGENGYVPREASLVMKRKYGDCKDKTSLLVAMMKSQGLHASYAWVGSRDLPYKFSEFSTGFNTNHVVAVWWDENNQPVILDGTTQNHSMEDIPAFIQGKECFIDNGPDKYTLYKIPVASPEKNLIYDSLIVELKGDTLIGYGISLYKGEKRAYMMDYFEGKNSTDLPKIVMNQLPKASNKFIVDSVKSEPISNNGTPFTFTYYFHLPNYLISNHTVKYLNLNLDRFPSMIDLKDDRWMPVELKQTMSHVFVCSLVIPEGYEIRELPQNSAYSNPHFNFSQNYSRINQTILLKTVVNLNFQILEGKDIAKFSDMLRQINTLYLKSIPMYKTITQ